MFKEKFRKGKKIRKSFLIDFCWTFSNLCKHYYYFTLYFILFIKYCFRFYI